MLMKIALAILVFVVATICFYLISDNNSTELIYFEYLRNTSPVPQNEVAGVIDSINRKNANIRSFGCGDVQIHIDHIPFRLRSFLYYEKDLNFRMVVQSIAGNELDIGSNPCQFWFWSKRMRPPALHYAYYKDLYKTQLKAPFHPLWMMECLGVGQINPKATIKKAGRYLAIEERARSTDINNEVVIRRTLIDPQRQAIVGHYLFDADGTMIASAETKEFAAGLPSQIVIIWHTENIRMTWDLGTVEINKRFNSDYWNMPNMKYRINMGQ